MPSTRTPSPPSAPPIGEAPGPRATQLHHIFKSALSSTLRTNSYENFSACFPTPASHCPTALENVRRQLNEKLERAAIAEFEDICREKNVVVGLNELDMMIDEARRRKEKGGEEPIAPHTLSAEQLYGAYLVPGLSQAEKRLEESLDASKAKNLEIGDVIRRQRGEIEMLVKGLEDVVKDMEGAAEAMEDSGAMRRDILDIDVALKT